MEVNDSQHRVALVRVSACIFQGLSQGTLSVSMHSRAERRAAKSRTDKDRSIYLSQAIGGIGFIGVVTTHQVVYLAPNLLQMYGGLLTA